LTAYQLLKDQGSIVGGLLAFVAGLLVYRSGRAQATAVNKQYEEFKETEALRLARSSVVAARMMDGVLAGIEDDLEREEAYVSHQQNQTITDVMAHAAWIRIRKPELLVVWELLSVLDRSIAKDYMTLDREIAKRCTTDISNPTVQINSMLSELRKLRETVHNLRYRIVV
jgi:hypothetical protein